MSPSPAAAGQVADAARLFEEYGERIERYCLGRLRDREEAADAVQNTFLRVHVALGKGVVPQYEAAWLYKIAHNVCLNRIESAGRRARFETPRDLDDHDLECALAVTRDEHEALAGLSEALAGLPHNLRQAILLREWQGLSYAEIAEAMETTVPAVETLLCRARRQLASALEHGGRRTRRAASALLDVLGVRVLVERLGGMLSGAGVAKVVAGAALLAAGGSGVGAAVALDDGSPSQHPVRPVVVRTAGAVPHARAAFVPTAVRSMRAVAPPPRPVAVVPAQAPSVVAPAAPQPVTPPPVRISAPVPAPAPAPQQPAAPAPASAATTAAIQTVSAVPSVSTPTVPSPPAVTTPTVSLPQLPPPSIVTPALTVPSAPALP